VWEQAQGCPCFEEAVVVVNIKTNFAGQVALDLDSPTLKTALVALSKKAGIAILTNQGSEDVQSEFKVYVDGAEYEHLPQGLNTTLTDRNALEVMLVILAGG
jgi:hypothetical protein